MLANRRRCRNNKRVRLEELPTLDAIHRTWSVSSPGCLLPARSLCPSGVIPSPRFACRLAGRGAGRCLSCRRAVRSGLSLVVRSPCRVAGRWAACLLFSSRYSVRSAFLVSTLSVGGGSLASTWLVSVNRHGWRGGSLVALCLLGWGWRWSVGIMWSVLFSVDYLGEDGYINTRAWMLFSPFFVSWHVLVVRAVLWFSAPIALVYAPINRFLRGTGGSDFFINLHLIPFHLPAACLLAEALFATRLPSYPYLPAPRPVILDTMSGEVHGCDTTDGLGRCHTCLISCVRWMATGTAGAAMSLLA